MEGQDIRGLIEAYSQVYETPEVLNEEVEQIDEMGQAGARSTGQNSTVFRGTPGAGSASGQGGRRGSGSSPGALKPSPTKPIFPQPSNQKPSPIFKFPQKPGTTPAAKPAPTAAAKPTPAGGSVPKPGGAKPPSTSTTPTKPAGSAMDQWAKANPKLAAAKAERDRTRGTSATTNPLMKDMKDRLPAPKEPAPSTAKTAFDLAKKGVNLAADVDIFDIVKGHLLDEGYAETEENALVIMANMSEEWRQSILDEASYSAKAARAGKDIGKPGKMFGKIAKEAGERYGSEERGKKVAGAVLAKLRKEEVEQIDEISKELATKAFATRARDAFEMDDIKQHDKADKTKERIVKKHGKKAGDEAEKAAERAIYGHNKYSEAQEREEEKKKSTKKEGIELEDILALNRKMERVYEAQRARENPEDHDKEEKRKYEPVRGEKTPMPPRGDKRREAFEKWYAANVR